MLIVCKGRVLVWVVCTCCCPCRWCTSRVGVLVHQSLACAVVDLSHLSSRLATRHHPPLPFPQSNKKQYDAAAASKKGFLVSMVDPAAKQSTFEQFRKINYKWQNRALKIFVGCLKSGEYVQIRNALIVLNKVQKVGCWSFGHSLRCTSMHACMHAPVASFTSSSHIHPIRPGLPHAANRRRPPPCCSIGSSQRSTPRSQIDGPVVFHLLETAAKHPRSFCSAGAIWWAT